MALDDDIARMERHPLLGLMQRDALRLLAFACETRSLRAGDVLFRRGDRADAAFFVVSGVIALSEADDGRAATETIGEGGLIGTNALFTTIERPATAIAREPARLMKLSRHVMRRVLEESPDSAVALAEALGGALREMSGGLDRVRRRLQALDG